MYESLSGAMFQKQDFALVGIAHFTLCYCHVKSGFIQRLDAIIYHY
jgi:hypothetical protein